MSNNVLLSEVSEDGPHDNPVTGSRYWLRDSQYHREDGPAVEWADGHKEWYRNGKLHREDGPAAERPNGEQKYYIHGRRFFALRFCKRYLIQMCFSQSLPNSINNFEMLARKDPEKLFEIIEKRTYGPSSITFAAEACGLAERKKRRARQVLLELLRTSEHPVEREGAIYGLQDLGPNAKVIAELIRRADEAVEPDATIRKICKTAVEWMQNPKWKLK